MRLYSLTKPRVMYANALTTAVGFAILVVSVFWRVVAIGVAGVWWIGLAVGGLRCTNDDQWARRMSRFSLAVLLILCVMFVVGPILP